MHLIEKSVDSLSCAFITSASRFYFCGTSEVCVCSSVSRTEKQRGFVLCSQKRDRLRTSEESNIENHAFLRENFANLGCCFILETTLENTLSFKQVSKKVGCCFGLKTFEHFFPCTFWCKGRLLLRFEETFRRRTFCNTLSFNFYM